MKPGAGETDDGRIEIGTGLVLRRGLRKPMLHVRAQPWAFEKNMSAHRRNMPSLRGRVTSVCLRRRGFWPRGAGAEDGQYPPSAEMKEAAN